MTTTNAPAGWYEDPNTGRQRYWDGTAWTAHVAPTPGTTAAGPATVVAPPRPRKRHNVLGYVGIGLGALALVGVSSPDMLFELIGGVLLLAGFVVSIVGMFANAPKWAAITGLGLCVLATIASIVFFTIGFIAGFTGAV